MYPENSACAHFSSFFDPTSSTLDVHRCNKAMGRKRNQGKARRAAKAKAREEAEEDGANNNQVTTNNNGTRKYKSPTKVLMDSNNPKCWHNGNDSLDFSSPFVDKFHESFIDAATRGERSLPDCLIDARSATMDEFADVWHDSAKLEMAISFFLFFGTQQYLGGYYGDACETATIARYFEQHIAVGLKQTQALHNWPKVVDTYYADEHTLVKFLWKRIPCSCLDEKYEEVKHITKMGICCNPQCSIPDKYKRVERSKAKYCSRCRCVTYCSRECQIASWKIHKPHCDNDAATIARFEDSKRWAEFRAEKGAEEEERRKEVQRLEREKAFKLKQMQAQMELERKREEELRGLKSMLHKAMLQSALEKMYVVNFQKWAEADGSVEDFDEFKELFKDVVTGHFEEKEKDLEEIFEELFEDTDEEFKKILLENRLEDDKKHAEILGVPHDVDKRTLHKAYRKLALQYHPDRWSADNERKEEAEEHFKSIRSSYEHLMAKFNE